MTPGLRTWIFWWNRGGQAKSRKGIGVPAAVLVSLLALVGTAQGISLGVDPGRIELGFVPNLERTYTLSAINSEDTEITVEISLPDGELKDYIRLLEDRVTLGGGETKPVHFVLSLPSTISPGWHENGILLRALPAEAIREGAEVNVAVGVMVQLRVLQPYPGKYGEIRGLDVKSVSVGDRAHFEILFLNAGTQPIQTAQGYVDIYNGGTLVRRVETAQRGVESGQVVKLEANWITAGAQAGTYKAIATVIYDGASTGSVEKEFRVGDVLLRITGISAPEIPQGRIGSVRITLESLWNKRISNAFVELTVREDGQPILSSKSASFDVEPWSTKEVVTYVDAGRMEEGTYAAEVAAHYEGHVTRSAASIRVVGSAAYVPVLPDHAGVTLGGGILLVLLPTTIVLLTILLTLRRRSRRRQWNVAHGR